MRAAPALALALALALLPNASAAKLAPDGQAVAGTDSRLVLTAPEHADATSALLRACVGDGTTVRFCYPPTAMRRVNNATWEVVQRLEGTSGRDQLGLNATLRTPDGNVSFPAQGEYVWFGVDAPARAPTPLPALLAGAALLAAAALLLAARRRG